MLDFVDHLVEWATGVPLFVLGTARPELLDRRPGWGGGKLNASTLALTPLADDEAAQIIHGVLEQTLLPAATQQALLERAGGNPLYAEQFARLYVERGSMDELPLPETIQGIVAARLDGLTDDEKRLIQDAAVVGKVFWGGAAAQLSGLEGDAVERCLHSLERKGLIRRERRSAVGGEFEYAFRHVLVRDVAYGQIPRGARVERHVRAADWIERLGRAEDHAELLAHHLGAALELSRATGGDDPELADRTRYALRRASERALALHAYRGALRLSGEALALWPDDEERPHLLAAHARACFRVEGDDTEFPAAVAALEAVGQVEAAADVLALAANAAWRSGRGADAAALVERAEQLLSGRAPSRALVAVLAEKARLLAIATEDERAEVPASRALELAEELDLPELRANILGTLGVLRLTFGRLDESRVLFERAIETAPPGSPEIARAMSNASLASYASGNWDEGWGLLHRAAEAAAQVGDQPNLIWIEVGIIDGCYVEGRWDEAVARVDAALATIEPRGHHYQAPYLRLRRAVILASRYQPEPAARDLEAALAHVDDSEDPQYRMPLLSQSAHVCLLLGDRERALGLMATAEEIQRDGNPRVTPPFAAEFAVTVARCGYGGSWLERFREAAPTPRMTAARHVWSGRTVEAAELYSPIAPGEEAAVRLLAAEQLAEAGRTAEASLQLQRALAFYRAVGATHVVREAETVLAAAS